MSMIARRPSFVLCLLCVAFIVGIAASSAPNFFIAIAAAYAVALFLFLAKSPRRDVAIAFLLSAIMFLAAHLLYTSLDRESNFTFDEVTRIEAAIAVREDDKNQKLTLINITQDGEARMNKILVFAEAFPKYEPGDVVQFFCSIQKPEPFDGFAYDKYLETQSVYGLCFRPSDMQVATQSKHPLFALRRWRGTMINHLDTVLGEPHATLMAGLLFGEDTFTDAWKERFQKTGTSHIVAASGYNVSVVAFVLFAILTALGITRKRAFFLLIAGIIFYVLLAGAEPPLIRAGIMGSLVLIGSYIGRKTSAMPIFLLTIAIMLAANPLLLFHNVGFQLSALSTLGLLLLVPRLTDRFAFVPNALGIRESLCATLAATIATLPIIITSFAQISVITVAVNMLVLPLLPYTMALGVVALIASAFGKIVGAVLATPAWAALTIILFVIESTAELPSVITVPNSPLAIIIILLITAAIVWLIMRPKKPRHS